MTVILQVLIEVHFHLMAVPAQVIPGQVYQHHMLGILLGIIAQILRTLLVGLFITCPLGSPRDGINIRPVAVPVCGCTTATSACLHNPAMCLRTAAEDSESTEIKIEKIGTRVDTPQRTIELEIIAFILLDKPPAEHNLKHITTQTMLNSFTDIFTMFIIGQRTRNLSHRMEIIRLHIGLVHRLDDILNRNVFSFLFFTFL